MENSQPLNTVIFATHSLFSKFYATKKSALSPERRGTFSRFLNQMFPKSEERLAAYGEACPVKLAISCVALRAASRIRLPSAAL